MLPFLVGGLRVKPTPSNCRRLICRTDAYRGSVDAGRGFCSVVVEADGERGVARENASQVPPQHVVLVIALLVADGEHHLPAVVPAEERHPGIARVVVHAAEAEVWSEVADLADEPSGLRVPHERGALHRAGVHDRHLCLLSRALPSCLRQAYPTNCCSAKSATERPDRTAALPRRGSQSERGDTTSQPQGSY